MYWFCEQHYKSIMQYINQGPLFLSVQMHQPDRTTHAYMDALQAFWPGLQVSSFHLTLLDFCYSYFGFSYAPIACWQVWTDLWLFCNIVYPVGAERWPEESHRNASDVVWGLQETHLPTRGRIFLAKYYNKNQSASQNKVSPGPKCPDHCFHLHSSFQIDDLKRPLSVVLNLDNMLMLLITYMYQPRVRSLWENLPLRPCCIKWTMIVGSTQAI